MPTYEAAPAEAVRRIEALVEKYHGPLRDAGVAIDCLFAFPTVNANGDDVGNAVSHGGYRCAAKVRVIGLKDRSKGMGDAEIVVDGRQWDEWDDGERDAVLDHELEHLELVRKKGAVATDDGGRPRLRCIKHDHQHGWFDAIVRRHGTKSLEWQQYRDLAIGVESTVRQLWLPYITTEVATGEAPAKRDGKAKAVAG